jgi:hypothetical protein
VAILLTIPLVLAFRWINFTLDKDLYGFGFAISGYSPTHPSFCIGSFGVLAAAILLAAAIAYALDIPLICYCSGFLLLLVMFWAYLRVAVGDAPLLIALARQSDWWLIIAGHPRPTARLEPGVWSQLPFDTLCDRLISGWYYLGLGWYLGVFVGIAVLSRGVATHYVRLSVAASMSGTIIGLLAVVFLSKPILAERRFISAMNLESRGQLLRAKDQYRKTMSLDSWYALNSRLYERIGALDEALGQRSSLEYRIYEAEQIFAGNQSAGSIGQLDLAIKYYDSVAETDGLIATAAKMRAADLRIWYGAQLFHDGSFGSAVALWTAALNREPDNWVAAYYLTLGYPTINGYRNLEELSERFLLRCRDPLTVGMFYNSLGMAQMQLGQTEASRRSFYASYHYDYLSNRTAVMSLIGP